MSVIMVSILAVEDMLLFSRRIFCSRGFLLNEETEVTLLFAQATSLRFGK
jgi:hypothetical protein